jgi:hypothetical protein
LLPSSVRFWALLLNLGCVASLGGAEPQVAFTLKKGWVEFAVRRDGKPVADALIHVIDERGNQFAEGETGPDGDAAFPAPPGASFIVEIKTGERTADPIRLFKTAGGVEPARVLLSYGLRPCCRSISRGEPLIVGTPTEPGVAPEESTSVGPWLAGILGGLIAITLLCFAFGWRQLSAERARDGRN